MRLADDDDKAAVAALQQAAYAKNRDLLGCEPLPLQKSIDEIFDEFEVWLLEDVIGDGRLLGVLIVEPRRDDLLVWSVAVHPDAQGRGIGKLLLQTAELRARQFGHDVVRLYTGRDLTDLIDWYMRLGFDVEREEELDDRAIVHMVKRLPDTAPDGSPLH